MYSLNVFSFDIVTTRVHELPLLSETNIKGCIHFKTVLIASRPFSFVNSLIRIYPFIQLDVGIFTAMLICKETLMNDKY